MNRAYFSNAAYHDRAHGEGEGRVQFDGLSKRDNVYVIITRQFITEK